MVPRIEKSLKEIHDCKNILEKCTPATLPTKYIEVNFAENHFQDDSIHAQVKCEDLLYPFHASPVIAAPIQDARILYDGRSSSKTVVEITLNIKDLVQHTFIPGDTIGVLVSNTEEDVNLVLLAMKDTDLADYLCEISLNSQTAKKNAKVPTHIPRSSSARSMVRDCLDLRSIPKKLFLRSLAEYTLNEDENKFLLALSSKEGSKLYNELIVEKPRTFLDILNLCPSCRPPFSVLIEHLPRLKPRPYSIANSPLANEGLVNIIFSVFPENPGVATSFLNEKAKDFLELPERSPTINIYFRQSNNFSYNLEDAEVDTILISIGCGVSPFLGFLEQKAYLIKENKLKLGSTWLFVGSSCRDSAVHREQLLEYKESNVLQELYESFSKDPEFAEFKHVQDQIKANALEFVEQFMKKDTLLYVCADGASISKSIESCIRECVRDVLECSESEAVEIIKDSRVSGKYREDVWV